MQYRQVRELGTIGSSNFATAFNVLILTLGTYPQKPQVGFYYPTPLSLPAAKSRLFRSRKMVVVWVEEALSPFRADY